MLVRMSKFASSVQQHGSWTGSKVKRSQEKLSKELSASTNAHNPSSQRRPTQQNFAQLRNDLFRTMAKLEDSEEREANLKKSLAQLQARFDIAETNYLHVRREKRLVEQTPNDDMMQHYLELAEENELFLKGFDIFDKELQDKAAILKAKNSRIEYLEEEFARQTKVKILGKRMEKLKIRHNEKLKAKAKAALGSKRKIVKALKRKHRDILKLRHRETATALATELRTRQQLFNAQDQIAELEKLLAEVVYAQQSGDWEMGALLAQETLQHPVYRHYKPDAKYQPWLKPPPEPNSDNFYDEYIAFLQYGKDQQQKREQYTVPCSTEKILKKAGLNIQARSDDIITLADERDDVTIVEQTHVNSAASNEEKVKHYLPGTSETEYILIPLHPTSNEANQTPLSQANVAHELRNGTVYNSIDDSVKYQGGRRVENNNGEVMLRNGAEWRLAVTRVQERLLGELGVTQFGPDGQTIVKRAMGGDGLKRSARWAARLFEETARNL